MRLVIRWAITGVSLFVAAWIVPGIVVERERWVVYALMAVILGLVNAVVRPVLKLLSCPLILLTLGLFTLVINGFTLWLASTIGQTWNVGFIVHGLWPAILGGIVVSVVSTILSIFVKDKD
jgi:putative membrane protein